MGSRLVNLQMELCGRRCACNADHALVSAIPRAALARRGDVMRKYRLYFQSAEGHQIGPGKIIAAKDADDAIAQPEPTMTPTITTRSFGS
jgi:hypothetical protein